MLYLHPKRNPQEISCPLPPQFYYTSVSGQSEITRETFHFSPVVIRTTIMWQMWIANIFLLIAAFKIWVSVPSKNSRGIQLLKKLVSLEKSCEPKLNGYSDLSYLMELVYVNRNRMKYVR